MAIYITNGSNYIFINQNGKYRKTNDVSKALVYKNVDSAVQYMKHAPGKTKGYYVLDGDRIAWKWKPVECKVKKKKPKRKKYSTTERKMIYNQTGGRCALCGERIKFYDMTLDHIKPLAMGGIDAVDNIQCACYACNRAKADFLPDDFVEQITEIFLYQMSQKYGKQLRWKIVHKLLKEMIE